MNFTDSIKRVISSIYAGQRSVTQAHIAVNLTSIQISDQFCAALQVMNLHLVYGTAVRIALSYHTMTMYTGNS